MSEKTDKQKRFEQFLYDIYGNRSTAMYGSGDCITTKAGSRTIGFSKRAISSYEELFGYTFLVEKDKIKFIGTEKKKTKKERITIYIHALSAIVNFFDLPVKYKVLLHAGIVGEELDKWGVKLYNCCKTVLEIFFDDEKEVFDSVKVSLERRNIMLMLDPSDEVNHETKATSIFSTIDFLSQTNYTMISKNICTFDDEDDEDDEDFYNRCTIEGFNECIDYDIKHLSELPDELDIVRIRDLYQTLNELRDDIKCFLYCLRLEKKRDLLRVLESTEDRFFKRELANLDKPLPQKSFFGSEEEWQACSDRREAFEALGMCIEALNQFIDYETKSQKDC